MWAVSIQLAPPKCKNLRKLDSEKFQLIFDKFAKKLFVYQYFVKLREVLSHTATK